MMRTNIICCLLMALSCSVTFATPVSRPMRRKIKLRKGNSPTPPSWWVKPDRDLKPEDRTRLNVRKSSVNATAGLGSCASRIGAGLPRCCDGQDPNCYTSDGCFCDVACHLYFGDCCPDHGDMCYSELKLCLFEAREKPKKRTRNPDHLTANACCDTKPYNTVQKSCCNGKLVLEPNVDCSEFER